MADDDKRHLRPVPDPRLEASPEDDGNVLRPSVPRWNQNELTRLVRSNGDISKETNALIRDMSDALRRSREESERLGKELASLEAKAAEGRELVASGNRYHAQGYTIGAFPTGLLDAYKAWWHDRPWQAAFVHIGLVAAGYLLNEAMGWRSRQAQLVTASVEGIRRGYDMSRMNEWPTELQLSEQRIRDYVDQTREPQRIIQETRLVEQVVNPIIHRETIREVSKPGARGPAGRPGARGPAGPGPTHKQTVQALKAILATEQGKKYIEARMPRAAIPTDRMSVQEFRELTGG